MLLLLFLSLITTTTVLGTELDTVPECEPYGVEFCYDCTATQDLSSFATHPESGMNFFCINCYTGYYLMAGRCYTMDELLEDLTVSVVNDIAVFQSDLLLDGYKSMWTWQSGVVQQDFDVYDTLGYVAQEVLGDKYDYLYVSAYNDVPAIVCAEQTNEADCLYVVTCEWQEVDETCSSVSTFPDRYHTHDSQLTTSWSNWQPYIYESKLKGVIRYNYNRQANLSDPSLTAYDMFGTHFHEIGHNFLVHGMELNPSNPHWGYSVLESQAEMTHKTWLPEEVSCFETGEPVTSPESCPPSDDGKRWLHFESSVEMVDEFHFSDWELLPMGLLHPDDLEGQTFFFCGSADENTALEVVSTDTGNKVGCNSVVFVTPEEWAWGEEYHQSWYEWHPQEGPFRAAHMVLQGTDEALPTTHDELNSYWKRASDLLPELAEEFTVATRQHGEVNFSILEREPECYIFRDDHILEGEWTMVGGLGAFTMEECQIQCTLREDCTAWRGNPYSLEETVYEVTGEQNGVVWGVSYCTIYTGNVTATPTVSSQQSAYGPTNTYNTYWSGERIFPIPEGCEGEGLTFPPTDLPTTAPSTEIPLCYFPHHAYGDDCSYEYPVQGTEISTEECEALCSQDEECMGWQYPTWCTLLKGSTCNWNGAGGWSYPVSFQKNPDYFPETCVSPPTPEPTTPTTTAEPTLYPTMENGLSPCYYEFTDAQVTGGQWESVLDISEEECQQLCSDDSECVGYSMQLQVWSNSLWAYVDKCWNYHGNTQWNVGFYTQPEYPEVLTYKKVLPEPENCVPGWQPANPSEVTSEPTFEALESTTLEPSEATLEPTMATNEPTEVTLEPTETTLEPSEATLEPTMATNEPTEVTLEPTEATLEPSEATLEPTMATNEPTELTLEPTAATLEPSEATLEPTMATNEPTELTSEPTAAPLEPTLEPSEATLEPTMATNEPTEATEVVQTSSPTETTVKFTQVVSAAEVECEEARNEVQSANAQALQVPTSSVDVSGCEQRRILAASADDVYEFLISIVAATATEADRLQVEVASSDFAEQVTQRLTVATVTSSSDPVVEYEVKSEESSGESEDQESDSQLSFHLPSTLMGIVMGGCAGLLLSFCITCTVYAACCRKKQQQQGAGLCEKQQGSRPAAMDLVL